MSPVLEVAGVDGCRAGWLVVRARAGRRLRLLSAAVHSTFADVLASTKGCAAAGVDIPIGLSDGPPRRVDRKARRLLGRPRASSVFPAPVRPALRARTYREACAISVRVSGKKISKETYNITAKIREVDDVMTPALQRRVVEVHPEVSFWALNDGQPLGHAKRTREGSHERLCLLSRVFDGIASVSPPAGAGWDDLYDACVAAWSAWRLARGRAQRLPPAPPFDARGLRMEIVC